ncbi:MAG: ABC transporter permease subunit, partial [Actinomycetales bacterium]
VILPQAFRVMIQPLGNVFIGIVLGTSLVAAVAVPDLTNRTEVLDLRYNEPLLTFGVAAVLYIAITLGGGLLVGLLERRLRVNR